jgi:DNA polymerase
MTDLSRADLARQIRQRLEDLRRSGLDRIGVKVRAASSRPAVAQGRPVAAPPARPTPAPPVAPEPAVSAPARPAPKPAPAITSTFFGSKGFDQPPLDAADRAGRLLAMAAEVATCTRCSILASTRTQTVFGEGDPCARLMFVGEGPGETEDQTGRPFVGRAGQLLTDMITKGMGLRREDVYIANIVKCRPPGNRDPMPDETRNCIGYLERQIETIRPGFLCLLGKPAAQTILDTALPMNRIRGRWYRYRDIPTLATWHPAYLLRNPAAKKETWDDLKMLMQAMGLLVPKKRPEEG